MTARLAEQWGKRLAGSVAAARDAVTKAGRKWELPVLFPDGLSGPMGSIAQLLKPTKGGKQIPCPRMFIYGNCSVRSCRQSHTLAREPGQDAVKKFLDAVEARCGHLKANPKD